MYAAQNTGTGATDSFGFPANSQTPNSPVDTASDPNQASSSWVDSVENAIKGIASDIAHAAVGVPKEAVDYVESGVEKTYGALKKAVSTVGNDVISGTHAVTNEVESVADYGISRILLVVVVVGAALYFIGKTGAVKAVI